MHRKNSTIILTLILWTVCCAARPVESLTFRPDPFGHPAQTVQIVGFDPGPGSLLAVDAIPVLQGGGGDLNVVYQSQLSDLLPSTILPGLGTSYQLLTLMNIRVHSIRLGSDVVSFMTPTTAGPNVVELRYHDLTISLDEQTGVGFNTPADPVIVRGRVIDFSGTEVLDSASPMSLDLSATGPADVDTLSFIGVQNVRVDVDFMNPLFFPDPSETLSELLITSLLFTPFSQVTPNRGLFFNGTTRNLGSVNGQDGPDIEYEADLIVTLQTQSVVAPEPSSLALLLLGLGVFGVTRATRMRSAVCRTLQQ